MAKDIAPKYCLFVFLLLLFFAMHCNQSKELSELWIWQDRRSWSEMEELIGEYVSNVKYERKQTSRKESSGQQMAGLYRWNKCQNSNIAIYLPII